MYTPHAEKSSKKEDIPRKKDGNRDAIGNPRVFFPAWDKVFSSHRNVTE